MTTELWFKDIVSSRTHSHHFGSIHSRLPAAQLVYAAAEQTAGFKAPAAVLMRRLAHYHSSSDVTS